MSESLAKSTAFSLALALVSMAPAAFAGTETLESRWRELRRSAFESGVRSSETGITAGSAGKSAGAFAVNAGRGETGADPGPAAAGSGTWKSGAAGKKAAFGGAEGTYRLSPGTVIPSVMLSGVNTDLPGYLVAQVSGNVYDSPTGQVLLIPQGSRLFGKYDSKVIFGQKRPIIAWSRLIFPDAETVELDGMPGADRAGYSGFKASVNGHFGPMVTTAAVASVFSGLAEALDDGGSSITISNPTINLSDSVPAGTVVMYAGTEAPDGWHLCDGSDIDDSGIASALGLESYPSLSTGSDSLNYIIKTESSSSALSCALALSGLSSSSKVYDGAGREIGGEIAEMLGKMGTLMFQKQLSRAPTLVVKPGYRFHAIVNRELLLPPWREGAPNG